MIGPGKYNCHQGLWLDLENITEPGIIVGPGKYNFNQGLWLDLENITVTRVYDWTWKI